MSSRLAFALAAPIALAACNGLTEIGKYDVSDCPTGDCDGGGAASDGGGAGGGGDATKQDASAIADASSLDVALDTAPTCGPSEGPVTLTVIPGNASVPITSNPPGLTVNANTTGTACLPVGQVELQPQSDIQVLWSGNVSCGQDVQNGRCRFDNTTAGAILSANE